MADEAKKVRELDVERFRDVWGYRFTAACWTALLFAFALNVIRSDDHWVLRVLLVCGAAGWWWTAFSALRIAHHVAGAGIRITIQKKPTTYSVKVAL